MDEWKNEWINKEINVKENILSIHTHAYISIFISPFMYAFICWFLSSLIYPHIHMSFTSHLQITLQIYFFHWCDILAIMLILSFFFSFFFSASLSLFSTFFFILYRMHVGIYILVSTIHQLQIFGRSQPGGTSSSLGSRLKSFASAW